MNSFQSIDPKSLSDNFFNRIGSEWSLVSAGSSHNFNTMTASWGGIGVLWNKNVAFTFIRDSRYTIGFIDANEFYTVSFFGGGYMKELAFCGKNSGRNVDKVKETGLTPVFNAEAPYFDEADLVLVCRKLYKQQMNADSFTQKELAEKFYSDNDWHELFVGEIVKVLKKI